MDKLQIQDGIQVEDVERLKGLTERAEVFVNKVAVVMIVVGLFLLAVAVWLAFYR